MISQEMLEQGAAVTVQECAVKVQEMVLSGNAQAAVQWAEAMAGAAAAYDLLREGDDD